jgi:hypothetical protein
MAASGIYCKVYRNRLADLASNTVTGGGPPSLIFDHWKIGEGGWIAAGPLKVPKTPPDIQTDLDAVISGGQFGVDPCPSGTYGGYLERAFSAGEVTDDNAGTVTINVSLAAIEPLLDDDKSLLPGNCGNAPELYEIGIFDADDTLVVYCTFDEVVKTSGKEVQFTIIVTY